MLDLPPALDVLQLRKPTASGAPKQRLSDPSRASAIVQALIYANRDRAEIDATVKGMLDGNAPYSYASLKREGQTYRTNVNFREGEAMMADAMTPFYDLFAESDTYCKIELEEEDSEKRTEWSRTVTQKFDELAKEWSGFDWNIQAILFDMVAYGKGFAMWPDKNSWQFRGVRQSRILVPDQTPSDPDQLEILVVRQSYTVAELYAPIRNAEAARAIGWNTQAVLEACYRAMPRHVVDELPIDWELLQQELKNHDLYQDTRSSVVRAAHIFVKEFNGKVSHLIIEETDGRSDGEKPDGVFLYKKIGRFNSFREVVCPIFYDIGDGTWHSIKGLALKLYPFIEIKNRLNCSVVDNAFINLSVLVRPTTTLAVQGAAIMQLGPLSVLPSNMEVQQWGLAGRMEEGLAVESALTRKLESNLGQYRKPELAKEGNPVTATQVTYDAAKEASLSKGAVNRFYVQLDMLFEQMFKRAINPNLIPDGAEGQNTLALKFQKRCTDAGVPKAKLMKPKSVRATRNMGNGSMFLRQQTVLQTAQFVPMMNEGGRQAWLDDAIAVMAGTEAVARWNPKTQLSNNLADEQAWAVMENAVLHMGAPVRWTQTQNNVVHAATHLKAAVDAVNSLNPQNGAGAGNPGQVLPFLDAVGPHIAQHLEQMARDPSQAKLYKQFEEQFNQLAKITDTLKKQAAQAQQRQQQEMQQQQERQNQVMSDIQLKSLETQSKIRQNQQKTDAMISLKQQKQSATGAMDVQRHRQQLALNDAATAAKIRRESIVANSKANGE